MFYVANKFVVSLDSVSYDCHSYSIVRLKDVAKNHRSPYAV